jgi:hypothetical protein
LTFIEACSVVLIQNRQIFSVIVPLFLAGMIFAASSKMDAEAIEADVTVAQVMDLGNWFQDGASAASKLVGTWTAAEAEVASLQILPFPVADNAVLVSRGNRMVPGFLHKIEGQDLLLVASEASEQLEIIPEIWWIDTHAGEAIIMRVENGNLQPLSSLDGLASMLQVWVEAQGHPAPDALAYRRKAG